MIRTIIIPKRTVTSIFHRYPHPRLQIPKRSFSNNSSSSSSFNYSAQLNGHSMNIGDLGTTFRYNILVSYQPKDRDLEKGELYQLQLSKLKNLGIHVSPTGEDNYVVAVNKKLGSVLIGVTDGVGGWAELGYDSSAISRELCNNLQKFFEKEEKLHGDEIGIKLLEKSFMKVVTDGIVKVGGTTVCFAIIDSLTNKITVTNLGDSWFGIFRAKDDNDTEIRYECVHQSQDQTHGFNTPYQLSVIPMDLQRESLKQGKRYLQDTASDADTYKEFQLLKGDIVMMATDGVTDNVCPEDIAIYLSDQVNARKGDIDDTELLQITKGFVTQVNKLSKDHKYPSVFAQNLSKLIRQEYVGGKYDDITVVILKVY